MRHPFLSRSVVMEGRPGLPTGGRAKWPLHRIAVVWQAPVDDHDFLHFQDQLTQALLPIWLCYSEETCTDAPAQMGSETGLFVT